MKREKKFDLEWIHIIAFHLLTIYYASVFLAFWNFIGQNENTVGWMYWPTLYFNQWRMTLLFVIFGISTRHTFNRLNNTQLPINLAKRGLISLISLGGILLIFKTGFNWGCLSFLVYLFFYTLISVFVFSVLEKKEYLSAHKTNEFIKKTPYVLYQIIVLLFATEITLAEKQHFDLALIFEKKLALYTVVYYFILFISGFFLGANIQSLWRTLKRIRYISFLIGLISFSLLTTISAENHIIHSLLKSTNTWSWTLFILGFGSIFNSKNKD